jgi:LysR family transcriptional regulator, regulator for metE and metH
MEIRHLKLIRTIADEGTITKAIDKLHLTQSALSHQLREAEDQLGTKIFDRLNKRMVLTKAGHRLYDLATEILSKMDQAKLEINQMVFGESGEIRLSAECFSTYNWLPAVMKRFHHLYPNVDLQINVAATHYPLQKLLAGELDLALTTDPIKNDRICYVDLFEDEMMAVVLQDHPWAGKKFLQPKDFADQHLIIHSLPMETVTVHQYFLKPAGIKPKNVLAVPMTEAAIEMVKANMGVVVLAKWAVRNYLRDGNLQLVKVGKNGLRRKHYLAYMRNKKHPAFFLEFVNFVQNEVTVL